MVAYPRAGHAVEIALLLFEFPERKKILTSAKDNQDLCDGVPDVELLVQGIDMASEMP